MPFDFGIGEIAIVVVIGLLVFGPKRLPEITKSLGSGMRDFRKGMAGEFDETPAAATATATAAAPVAAEPAVMPAPPVEPVAAAAAVTPASSEAPVADVKPAE